MVASPWQELVADIVVKKRRMATMAFGYPRGGEKPGEEDDGKEMCMGLDRQPKDEGGFSRQDSKHRP